MVKKAFGTSAVCDQHTLHVEESLGPVELSKHYFCHHEDLEVRHGGGRIGSRGG